MQKLQLVLETEEDCCPKCGAAVRYRTQQEFCRVSGKKACLKKMYNNCPKVHDEYSAAHAVSALPCDKCDQLVVYEDMGTLLSIDTEIKFNRLCFTYTHKCDKCKTKFIVTKRFDLPLRRF